MVVNNNIRIPSRVITKEEVNRVLIEISKYLYLNNFNITLSNKMNQNGKFVITYKVNAQKNGEKVTVNDNFII
jgi:hypothetical protein